MKEKFLIIFTLSLSTFTQAQQQIKIEDLSKYVGDSITVCAKVYGGIFLSKSKDAPTLLNLGENYPNALLTVVI